jgi:hypothetical protein
MVWPCRQKSYFWGLISRLLIKQMINKVAGILIFCAISLTAFSQTAETKKSVARPDIPGIFTLELGLNRSLNGPEGLKLGLWGSRTFNIYYQYELRILKSNFSLVPGIGLSLERFKFRNGDIISYPKVGAVFKGEIANADSVVFFNITQHQVAGLKKSQLITNYLEVPVELRYTFNPDDPARSMKISVGGRVGYLYDSFSKVKYKENGEIKQLKNKESFNINKLRYGVFAKVGFGSFSLFGYYNLSPLFKNDEGVANKGVYFNEMNTFTAGISLSSF